VGIFDVKIITPKPKGLKGGGDGPGTTDEVKKDISTSKSEENQDQVVPIPRGASHSKID